MTDPGLQRLLDQLKDWDLRFRADQPTYPAAMGLAGDCSSKVPRLFIDLPPRAGHALRKLPTFPS